jgi:histidine triad (HIT) family protein
MPTLFTRIIQGEIPGDVVYQDEHVVAFRDIDPKAPVHVVLVPRREIAGVAEVPFADDDHRYLLEAARRVAEAEGLTNGYRLVVNQGEDAGQTVDHLHVHLLGGRPLGWPPG